MKVLIVHTLYTDDATMGTIIGRLVEHSYPFHFTGEYLYSNSPWDNFLKEYCGDLTAPITTDAETWAGECFGFDTFDTDNQ